MNMRRVIWPLTAALIGVALGGAAQRHRDHSPLKESRLYRDRKTVSLLQEADKAPRDSVLMIGDSITERAWAPTLCGRPALNAGVSAARTVDMVDLAKALSDKTHPSLTVVALGTNDAGWGATPIDQFKQDYRALLAPIRGPMMIVGIPPIEAAKLSPAMVGRPVAEMSAAIAAQNVALEQIAAEHHAIFVRPLAAMPTLDGAHPTAEGGRMWVGNIERSCPRT